MSRDQRGRVHQVLRRGTAAAHKALDHHRLMQRLTGRDLTREQYAETLVAMCRPHAELERGVHESRHHLESGLALLPRLDLLEADLFELGQPVPAPPPASQTSPDPSGGRAAWWGRVYVLEGSRQGSVVIARCLQLSLGDTAPRRFFGEAMVPGASSMLVALLERELQDDDALEQAVAGAREAFAAYKAGLDAFDSEKRAGEMR